MERRKMDVAAWSIVGLIILAVAGAIYFIPSIVAYRRKSKFGLVLLINTLFGWTAIGWAFALILALDGGESSPLVVHAVVQSAEPPSVVAQIERLHSLLKSGALTPSEFEVAKRRVLNLTS